MKYPELSGHEISGSDPLDTFIGRTLKIWINSFRGPGEKEKVWLLQAAAAMENERSGLLGTCLMVLASLRWLIENLFFGSADQSMTYSLSAEHAFSQSNNLTLLMAKRGALDSYPIQMGFPCLIK